MALAYIEKLLNKLLGKQFLIEDYNYNAIKREFQKINISRQQILKIDKMMNMINKKTQNQEYYNYIRNRIKREKQITRKFHKKLLKLNLTG